MLGFYENFPVNIHRVEAFTTSMAIKSLQQRMIKVLCYINSKKFSFEEVSCPTVPKCTIIFEAGLADSGGFNFIDEEETRKVLNALRASAFQTMDFFCAIRYYKGTAENKTPLKFDYYMLRIVFGRNSLEIQVFHERGPRYVTPEDIVTFVVNEVNKTSSRRILNILERT